MRPALLFTLLASAIAVATTVAAAEPPPWLPGLTSAVNEVNSIGREGKNGKRAADAARSIADRPPEAIPDVLAGCRDANPLAANLLRSAVETIVDRAAREGKPLPNEQLEAFVRKTEHDPRARRLAYELLLTSDPSAETRLIPGMLADPGPEFRRDAVAYQIAEAERLKTAGMTDAAKSAYENALAGAIDDDQVRKVVEGLKGYGVAVDVPRHFGFVTEWKVIGPFDNRGMKGFDAVYPPEETVDFAANYEGQLGEVAWKPLSTDDDYGTIDIAKQIENYKGSVMYFAAEFESSKPQAVELRLGTANAWKLWLNGEFLFGREEYHRGTEMDQYRVPASMKTGRNVILFKILQNEQSEDWAQSYQFRLRVSDAAGVAVLPVETHTSE